MDIPIVGRNQGMADSFGWYTTAEVYQGPLLQNGDYWVVLDTLTNSK